MHSLANEYMNIAGTVSLQLQLYTDTLQTAFEISVCRRWAVEGVLWTDVLLIPCCFFYTVDCTISVCL